METRVEEIGPLTKELVVGFTAEEVEKRHEEIINLMASRLNLKGFRKGKVPADVARRYVRLSAEEQLLLDLLRDSMEKAMEEAGIGMSDFQRLGFYLEPIRDDGSFEYRMELKLYPEVDPDKYLGMEVSIEEPPEITSEDLEKRIEEIRQEALQPQEKDGEIEVGDLINLTYSRYEEGNDEPLLKDFSTALRIEEDKDLLIKGLKEALLGLKKDDTFDVTGDGTVGRDAKTYRLAGKIDKVSVLVVPELDDEFARRFGEESMDAFRESVRKAMEEEREARRKALIEEELRKQLLDMLPEENDNSILTETFFGIDDDSFVDSDYFEDPENIEKMVKMIKEEAIIMAIASKEDVDVTEDDIEQELQSIAASSGQPLPYVRAQNRARIEDGSLAAQVKQKKVMDLLVRYAKVNDQGKGSPAPEPKQEPEAAVAEDTANTEKEGEQ